MLLRVLRRPRPFNDEKLFGKDDLIRVRRYCDRTAPRWARFRVKARQTDNETPRPIRPAG